MKMGVFTPVMLGSKLVLSGLELQGHGRGAGRSSDLPWIARLMWANVPHRHRSFRDGDGQWEQVLTNSVSRHGLCWWMYHFAGKCSRTPGAGHRFDCQQQGGREREREREIESRNVV
jgi:hypothetical protein